MKPASIMVIAGDASADEHAASLVTVLRKKISEAGAFPTDDVQPLKTELAPVFFGAGGSRMKTAGVDLAFDLTQHSIIGITRALRAILTYRRLFNRLLALAIERQPEVIIGVDFGGFNTRFASAIRQYAEKHSGMFQNWKPKIVQYISPQVWASRPGRAHKMAISHDLILSIFPFEKNWYARRVPQLPVEFVGHPMLDRYQQSASSNGIPAVNPQPHVVLLPGSRPAELRHHLEMMLRALRLIRVRVPELRATMIVPNAALGEQAKRFNLPADIAVRVGGLSDALANADLAISKTGTITMECALFRVPTVTFYRLSWIEYQLAIRLVNVKWATMPNLLADEEVFPEFIQDRATPENISAAALELLQNQAHRQVVKTKLDKIISLLGGPGATDRAAEAVVSLLK